MRTLKLGLALGAGGTKGAAHVGVLKVLAEAGIPIDAIAGTSIGSLYGGAFAAGHPTDEMEFGIRTYPRRDLLNFFRHRLKLRHNNRLARVFYEALAGQHIENLPIKFAATASDIVARCSYSITTGPIIDAIEASIAIPVIARPVMYQGRYLLDGGFWDSAPVNAATDLGADVIVAVELGTPYQLPQSLRAPATWLAQRFDNVSLRRTFAGVPFTIDTVTKDRPPTRQADLVIRPSMKGFNANSPFTMVQCMEAGIEAAQEALPAIRAVLAGQQLAAPAREFEPARGLITDRGLA